MGHLEMTDEFVLVDAPATGLRLITVNRPDRRNALNLAAKSQLVNAIQDAERDPKVRVILLTGAASCFVAGTDLDEQIALTPTAHTLLSTDQVFNVLHHCSKPLIAAVEGYALGGGCELALACDVIVAGEGAKFGLPEVKVGVMPGAGGTQRLLRTIGKYKTMRMVLTGELVEARDAFDMGFVSKVTERGKALGQALVMAKLIAAMPPLAVRAIKEVVRLGADLPLEAALLLERKAFQVLFDSDDQAEGMRAFAEKRPPNFKGS
jgi:enoyl-CoA hydratase